MSWWNTRQKRWEGDEIPQEGNFKGQYQSRKTMSCPFCGNHPILVPWHGGPKSKRNLMCYRNECPVSPSICENTEAKAIKSWNTRVA